MKIPASFYGSSGQVKKRSVKLARRMVEQDSFDLMTVEPAIDTSEASGLILVNPGIGFPGDVDFQCHALTLQVMMACPPRPVQAFLERWMLWCFEEAWRFLFVIGRDASAAFRQGPDRFALMRRYVEAGINHFDELSAEGPRFGPTVGSPGELWNVWGTMWYALAQLGVPTELLQTTPPGGPASLVKYIDSAKHEP